MPYYRDALYQITARPQPPPPDVDEDDDLGASGVTGLAGNLAADAAGARRLAAAPAVSAAASVTAPLPPRTGLTSCLTRPPERHLFRGTDDRGFWQYFDAAKLCAAPFFGEEQPVELTVEVWEAPPPPPPYDSKKATGMVGLYNQGATCYMNALLQVLFHCNKLRAAVYAMPTEGLTEDSMALALQRVFVMLQTSPGACSTVPLTKAFGWTDSERFQQQDVQELNRLLCDKLEEKMKGTVVDGTIGELFEGKVRSFIRCVNVPYESAREESFYDIALDVQGCASVEASFKKYVEVERLDGENQYNAEGDFGRQDADKGVSFVSFPPVLNLLLKRFVCDLRTGDTIKLNDRFEFPERLDLDAILGPQPPAAQAPAAPSEGAAGKGEAAEAAGSATADDGGGVAAGRLAEPAPAKRNVYLLHSVVVHSGSYYGGHYYAYVRPRKGFARALAAEELAPTPVTVPTEAAAADGGVGAAAAAAAAAVPPLRSEQKGRYFLFDDDVVKKAATRDAVEFNFGGPTLHTSAYMLVYVREGDIGDVMVPLDESSIPAHLTERFIAEEASRAAVQAAKREAAKYMNVAIASAEHVAMFDKYTCRWGKKPKTFVKDFVLPNDLPKVKVRKAGALWEVAAAVEEQLGVPVHRQRLWSITLRENSTKRVSELLSAALLDK